MSASADTRESITVMAPHSRTTGRGTTGAPIETMNAESTVYYGDLNLATESGRRELDDRVAAAADSACKWLDEVFPPQPGSSATAGDCRRDAIKQAQSQVNDAIGLGG